VVKIGKKRKTGKGRGVGRYKIQVQKIQVGDACVSVRCLFMEFVGAQGFAHLAFHIFTPTDVDE